ncbi:TPA: hypothetical protein ACIR07_000206 [Enterobacter hormaechei]
MNKKLSKLLNKQKTVKKLLFVCMANKVRRLTMALSRAQHEANKANGSYQTDRSRHSFSSLSLKLPACRLFVQPSGYES